MSYSVAAARYSGRKPDDRAHRESCAAHGASERCDADEGARLRILSVLHELYSRIFHARSGWQTSLLVWRKPHSVNSQTAVIYTRAGSITSLLNPHLETCQ